MDAHIHTPFKLPKSWHRNEPASVTRYRKDVLFKIELLNRFINPNDEVEYVKLRDVLNIVGGS